MKDRTRPFLPTLGSALAPLTLSALACPGLAQTGPFQNGDILVRTSASAGININRVNPLTGNGATLANAIYWSRWAGSMVYDPYRDALLVNASFAQDTTFYARLWSIDGRGKRDELPGWGLKSLRAITPTGDGRIFLMEHQSSIAAGPMRWIDAQDNIHTLLDASGLQPLTFPVEHMLYHAPSNALIASNSGWWASNDCASNGVSFFRIPLSADGTRVGGPITCSAYSDNTPEVMGLDWLPSGAVLATLATGGPTGAQRLVTVDPLSLAVQSYANPSVNDINGGAYIDALGEAVILDDGINQLRRIPAGLGAPNQGAIIPTNVPLGDASTGYSPHESMVAVRGVSGHCSGYADVYGQGVTGAAGYRPSLSLTGCPDLGNLVTLQVADARGGALGFLGVSLAPAALPYKGGTLLVAPSAAVIPFQASGTPNQYGAGRFSLPITLSQPALVGFSIYTQVLFADDNAPFGASMSNGLEIRFG
jgi:hypothetical protein